MFNTLENAWNIVAQRIIEEPNFPYFFPTLEAFYNANHIECFGGNLGQSCRKIYYILVVQGNVPNNSFHIEQISYMCLNCPNLIKTLLNSTLTLSNLLGSKRLTGFGANL